MSEVEEKLGTYESYDQWWHRSPVTGVLYGPFSKRSDAREAGRQVREEEKATNTKHTKAA